MQVDWLTLSDYTGGTGSTTITGTVTDNLNIGVNRYATVRFTNEAGLYADLNITQTAFTEGLEFSVNPLLLEFQTSGETLSATVLSNSKWFVTEYPSWVSITSDNPQMIGAGHLSITAGQNTGSTQRSGNIKVESYGEERLIFVIQPAYSTLRVNPKEIILYGATGATATTSVTVTSSANWTVSDYDPTYIQLDHTAGTSGSQPVYITLQNVPDFVISGGVPFQQKITFTDGITSEVVTINLNGTDNIDDNYVYVTYCINGPGMFLAFKFPVGGDFSYNLPPSMWTGDYMDDYTIEAKRERSVEYVGGLCIEFINVYLYSSVGGCHTVRYYSPYYAIPSYAFYNNQSIYSVVFGDQNEGDIMTNAFLGSSLQKLVLGFGRHSGKIGLPSSRYLGDYFYIPSVEHWNGDIGGNADVVVTEQDSVCRIVCQKAVFINENIGSVGLSQLNYIQGRFIVFTNPTGVTPMPDITSAFDYPGGTYDIYFPSSGWDAYHYYFSSDFLPSYVFTNNLVFNLIPYDDINDVPI